MDNPKGHYAKQNRDRNMNMSLIYMESKKDEAIETGRRMVLTQGWRLRKMGRCW